MINVPLDVIGFLASKNIKESQYVHRHGISIGNFGESLYMKSSEIRKAFLDFFQSQQHKIVASGSLVPHGDQTLLFTNAGMNQFKELFLGKTTSYKRAVTSQRCVRAGGKHNDLENVGYTARHHTFFEMLGNFSFGDYFKKEAIQFAWKFLTEVLFIPEERLWVTIFHEDKEAEDIWLQDIKVSPNRFSRLGKKDNFWSMGDTGPCGPCSEIFYDHGKDIFGDPPGGPNDGDRYVEIWNMVFMQYNRDEHGVISPLPAPSIDTGMGLERISAVMQGVHNNYDIDIFQTLIENVQTLLKKPDNAEELSSLRVISDHIRSCAFLIADGVQPSNEGRGYVLRRIIRRACRHGHKLGASGTFFYKLVRPLITSMNEAADIIHAQQNTIEKILRKEEESFARTLDNGLRLLQSTMQNMKKGDVIEGKIIFTLYDTYGFPFDLTHDIAREKGLSLDQEGYEACMAKQRLRARSANKFKAQHYENLALIEKTKFIGYEINKESARIVAIWQDGKLIDAIKANESAALALDQTPFYGESGGQVGDTGYFLLGDSSKFIVTDTQKVTDYYVHAGYAEGGVSVGSKVVACIDTNKRKAIAKNHSATHLLHAALCRILGDHVQQKGSLVTHDRLRFDFSHESPVTQKQLVQIERIVNEQIMENTPVKVQSMTLEQAIDFGARALFTEKYENSVRVLSMGISEFSVELCGGTHVERTGDIGQFRLTAESGISAGVRRVEAVTANEAQCYFETIAGQIFNVRSLLKSGFSDLVGMVDNVLKDKQSAEEEVRLLNQQITSFKANILVESSSTVESAAFGSVKLLVSEISGVDAHGLRKLSDILKSKLGNTSICVLAAKKKSSSGVALVATVTPSLHGLFRAGDLVKQLSADLGGKGGGRPDFAQGAGMKSERLTYVLDALKEKLYRGLFD